MTRSTPASLLVRCIAVLAVVGLAVGCGDDDDSQDDATTDDATTDDATTDDGADDKGAEGDDGDGGSDTSELCEVYQQVNDFDAEVEAAVNQVMAPLMALDPESPEAEQEAEALIDELKQVVAEIDLDAVTENYDRLAELVPDDLSDDAIALRDGTIEIVELFGSLEYEDLEEFSSVFNTPGIMAAAEATTNLNEHSEEECDISIT
jgi:hypothetical protein